MLRRSERTRSCLETRSAMTHSVSTAMMGDDSGKTIFRKIRKSVQPSKNDASCSSHGMEFAKNVRATIRLYTEMLVFSTSPIRESSSPRSRIFR